MNAGAAQFGSTSFTFLVCRIFAALVFGAQLRCACAVITHAQRKSSSEQASYAR